MSSSAAFLSLEKSVEALGALSPELLTLESAAVAVREHEALYLQLSVDPQKNHEGYFAGSLIHNLSQSHENYGLALQRFSPDLAEIAGFAAKEMSRRAELKEVRKAVDSASFLRDSINVAKALTPELAKKAVDRDISDLNKCSRTEPALDRFYKLSDMALKAVNSPVYQEALDQASPAVAHLVYASKALEFLPISERVEMSSLPGYRMVYESAPGLAGAKIVRPDGSQICLGGPLAIEEFAQENALTDDDRTCLLLLDSLVDIFELRVPAHEKGNDLTSVSPGALGSMGVPESCTKFFGAILDGRQAGLDVNSVSGDVLCMMSMSLDGKTEGAGTPGIPFTEQWLRVASCKDRVLAVDASELAFASQVAPQVTQAVTDFNEALGTARERCDSGIVTMARVDDGVFYAGEVVAVTGFLALQSAGRGNFNLHQVAALDHVPDVGQSVEIRYKAGMGAVLDKSIERSVAAGVGR